MVARLKKVNTLKKFPTQPKLKVSKIRKKVKTREVEIISRKAQGRKWKMTATVPRLEKKVSAGGAVASMWIAEIYWVAERGWAHMVLLNGYGYNVYIPFSVFEAWYYATSKGTFFNYMIKDKYRVVRTA